MQGEALGARLWRGGSCLGRGLIRIILSYFSGEKKKVGVGNALNGGGEVACQSSDKLPVPLFLHL